MLENESYDLRRLAALSLREIGNSSAVEPLLHNIFAKERINQNGTFVYALMALDCSKNIKEIFQILFYQGYEAKYHACEILEEQEFEFTRQDIHDIKAMWEDLKLHPEKGVCFENNKDMIEAIVTSYLPYLDELN